MPIDPDKLREKVERMPEIKQTIRKVTDKKNREWYIVETKITTWFSSDYMNKVALNVKTPKPMENKQKVIF